MDPARSFKRSILARLNLVTASDVRRSMPLQMNDLYQASELWTESPHEILTALGFDVQSSWAEEYRAASKEITSRALQIEARYPGYFAIESRTEELLFLLVRAVRPDVVLETGIGNGRSTAILLAALDHNGAGQLHSVDISDHVGGLIPHAHPRSVIHIGDGSSKELDAIARDIGPIDLFIHDSNHRYETQFAEYEIAERHGADQVIIASDDVNWSNAFIDFCSSRRSAPIVLSDVSKFFGIIPPPGTTAVGESLVSRLDG